MAGGRGRGRAGSSEAACCYSCRCSGDQRSCPRAQRTPPLALIAACARAVPRASAAAQPRHERGRWPGAAALPRGSLTIRNRQAGSAGASASLEEITSPCHHQAWCIKRNRGQRLCSIAMLTRGRLCKGTPRGLVERHRLSRRQRLGQSVQEGLLGHREAKGGKGGWVR